MKLKKTVTALIIAATLAVLSGTASAHVTVWPKQSTAGSYEKYTVRVPVEKDLNTTKVRLEFPQGVKVGTVMPQPGWTYEWDKDDQGVFTALTWTATGAGIKPHEFSEFSFSGKNPDTAGDLAWKAYQTYSDGTVVEWTGAEGTDTPASVTVLSENTAGDEHDHDATQNETTTEPANQDTTTNQDTTKEAAAEETTSSSNTLPLVLSGLALLVAVISLFRKRS
ncbi:MAG TPA: YcnI family protein [Bacilli bacterium]|nr:YcnI family protein [Bacilli bacterium]